jgi:DnaJ-domain-containing protein 1
MIAWSDVLKPTDSIRYTHSYTETPIGIFTIEWKAHKEDYHDYTIYLRPDGFGQSEIYIGTGWDLEDAKKIVENYLTEKRDSLAKFLSI